MTRALVVVMVVAGLARADMPSPRHKGPPPRPLASVVPMRSVPCMPDAIELRTTDTTDVVACWRAGCMKLDLAAGTATVVKEPSPHPHVEAVAFATVGSVCLGEKPCRPTPPKLEEALFREAKRPRGPDGSGGDGNADATTDLRAVLYDGVWSVPLDRTLKLVPPARVKKPAEVENIVAVGKWLVVEWPGELAQIVDSSGVNRGAPLAGGGAVVQLDAKRFVVISARSAMQVVDLATAKLRGSAEPSTGFVSAVRLTNAIAIARETGHGFAVERFTFDGDRPARAQQMALPRCTP